MNHHYVYTFEVWHHYEIKQFLELLKKNDAQLISKGYVHDARGNKIGWVITYYNSKELQMAVKIP